MVSTETLSWRALAGDRVGPTEAQVDLMIRLLRNGKARWGPIPLPFVVRRWVERRRWNKAPGRLVRLLPSQVTEAKFRGWMSEVEPITAELRENFSKATWAPGTVQGDTAAYDRGPILYALVRALGARSVVETGVASGSSSRYILEALRRNGGGGRLCSIDLPDGTGIPQGRTVGWQVPENLRENWTLTLGDAKVELPKLLEGLKEIDLFFHDSDHSEEHMTFEFTQVWSHLRDGGVLGSDDVYWNQAWERFLGPRGRPEVLVGGMGFTSKGRSPPATAHGSS